MTTTTTSNTTHLDTETHSSLGITLATRQTTSHSHKQGYTGRHPLSDNTTQEQGWTLDNMLERYSFKATYPWSTTDNPHATLAKLRVPQDLIVNTITNAPFSSFMFWRGDVELHFQVTGTPFHQGMLAAVFVPLTNDSYTTSNILSNFSSLSVNQVCYLFPNTNTSAIMNIPYNSVQQYLDLSDNSAASNNNTLGYVYIVVFNRLELASTASDTCTVSLFSKFVNNRFKVPRQSSPIVLSAFPQSGVLRFVKKLMPKHIVKDLIDTSVDTASTYAKSTITGLISNLDKPTDANMTRVVNSGLGRLNFSEGIEPIDKMTYAADSLPLTTDETFATNLDEMSMSHLKQKYSYLGTFDVTTTNQVGDVVASFPLNPNPNTLLQQANNIVPLLSYIASPFQYWTGSLNYKFVVVATSLQTCKMFAAISYGSYTNPTSVSPSVITSQYGEAFEINQGSNQIEITVPYNSTTPVKHIPNGWAPSSTDTLGMMNIIVLNKLVAPNNTPTTIHINVFISGGPDFNLTTLSPANQWAPIELPNIVQLSQDELLDDDIEIITVQKRKSQKIVLAKPQAGTDTVAPFVTTETNIDLADEQLVSPMSTVKPRESHIQPYVESIRTILKKYQLLYQVRIAIPAGGTGTSTNGGIYTRLPIVEIFNHLVDPIPNIPPTNNGLLSLYSALFRQFHGSLRFKITADTWSGDIFNNFAVYYEPPINRPSNGFVDEVKANNMYANASFVYPAKGNTYNLATTSCNFLQAIRLPVHYSCGIEKTAEFETPFTSRFSSLLIPNLNDQNIADREVSDFGTLVIYAANSSANTTCFNVYASLGDEARFGNIYQVPRIRLYNEKNGTTQAYIAEMFPDLYTPTTTSFNTLTII